MAFAASSRSERSRAAIVAGGATALLGYALIAGLAIGRGVQPEAALQLFDLSEPPAPKREESRPPKIRSSRPEGAAAPPHLRSEPTEIVAPEPAVILPVPPPVVAAPIAGTGVQASAGAAEVAGPGTGAGGEGNGRGGGGSGDGDGGGEVAPRWVRGSLRDSDYPKSAADAGVGGTVEVRYTVWTDGRVSDCEVTGSSGNSDLDQTTCRLIKQRFRFKPSLDRDGRPVPARIVESHSWILQREPADTAEARQGRRRG